MFSFFKKKKEEEIEVKEEISQEKPQLNSEIENATEIKEEKTEEEKK